MPLARSQLGDGACRARIVGLGSPFGDDRAGWEVVSRLRDVPLVDAHAETTSDPLRVLDGPVGCELLVVIDACRGAGPPGSVHRFEWPDVRLPAAGGMSSHGVGLEEVLALAGALDQLPRRVVVFAIEGEAWEPGAGLSRAVESALPDVVARVRAELAEDSPRRTE